MMEWSFSLQERVLSLATTRSNLFCLQWRMAQIKPEFDSNGFFRPVLETKTLEDLRLKVSAWEQKKKKKNYVSAFWIDEFTLISLSESEMNTLGYLSNKLLKRLVFFPFWWLKMSQSGYLSVWQKRNRGKFTSAWQTKSLWCADTT